MKNLSLLFIMLLCGLTSCKKQSQNAVMGKWQETKLRMVEDSANVKLYDTTYLQPFSNLDYAQFNQDATCVIATDHYYYLNSPGSPKTPQAITSTSATYNYYSIGPGAYIMSQNNLLVNPGGFVTADTVFVSGSNNLVVRSVFYGHVPGFKFITDSYYSK